MKNLILIGMPGVGKSTIGVIAAKSLGFDFVDSDILIQKQEKKLLKEIIQQEGIDGFLQIENQVNKEIDVSNSVIAPGGSVVYCQEAMEHFQNTGVVIYLKISYKTIEERLDNIKGRGVVLKEGQTLADLYEERCVLFERYSHAVVDEEGLDIEQTITKVLDTYHQFN